MPRPVDPDGPGPFERVAMALYGDRALFAELVREHSIAVREQLERAPTQRGLYGEAELRAAVFELATTSLALLATLGHPSPMLPVQAHAARMADRLEDEASAA